MPVKCVEKLVNKLVMNFTPQYIFLFYLFTILANYFRHI